MNKGTYEEDLPMGGKLCVTKNSWKIEYYFPGPDLRYNGTFMSISSYEVDQYIKAIQFNWEQYEHLQRLTPGPGKLTKDGRMGMPIRIGGDMPGIYLKGYHMRLSTQSEIDRIVKTYQDAKARAVQIQEFLAML